MLAHRQLGQAEPVPRVRPLGLDFGGPLELPGSIVEVAATLRQLPEAIGKEAELQMEHGVVPIDPRDLDHAVLEREQRQGVIERFQLLAEADNGISRGR